MLRDPALPARRPSRARAPLLALVPALLSALLLLAWPRPALAHTALTRSSPAKGERLAAAPTAIRLWFNERVQAAISRVRLVTPTDTLTLAVAADTADARQLVATPARPLAPGSYVVEWRTAGRDGHPVHGRFSFTVAEPAATPPADSAAPPAARPDSGGAAPARGGAFNVALDSMMRDAAEGPAQRPAAAAEEAVSEYRVARWAEFVALLAALGVVAFRFLVAPRVARAGHGSAADDATDGARQLGLGALVLLVAAGAARLYGEASALAAPGAPVTMQAMRTIAGGTDWGHGWMAGIAAALLTLVGLLLAKRSGGAWAAAAVGAIGLVVAPALTGHAAATHDLPALAVGADVLHVAGAGAWLGTLLVVLLAGLPAVRRRPPEERGPATEALVAAYHPVALASVGLVVLAGLVLSAVRLRSFSALTLTSYGSLLLYKIFVFLFVGLVGLYNWKKVLPRMGQEAGARRFRRSATVELLVGTIVLALTAVLVATEPPDMAELPHAAHGHPVLPDSTR